MNRRLRTGIIISIAGIGVVVFGLFILSRMFTQVYTPPPQPTSAASTLVKVVVLSRDVSLGTVLKADDLQTVQVAAELVPQSAVKDADSTVGLITKVPLYTGQMIMTQNLADPTNVSHDIAFTIDDTLVVMAFPANDLMSTLNILQRGDVVDIFVSIQQTVPKVAFGPGQVAATGTEQETLTRLFTFDALQGTEVTAIVAEVVNQESSGVPGGDQPQTQNQRVKAYLLALKPDDALVLKHLKDAGATFDLVLRSPKSDRIFDLNPILSEYVIDRYKLVVSP